MTMICPPASMISSAAAKHEIDAFWCTSRATRPKIGPRDSAQAELLADRQSEFARLAFPVPRPERLRQLGATRGSQLSSMPFNMPVNCAASERTGAAGLQARSRALPS